MSAGAQQLDSGLVANLHAAASEQSNSSREVGRFAALVVIEFGTRRTQLIVKEMNQRVLDLAHIAMLFFVGLNKGCARHVVVDLVAFDKFGWKNVWRDKHWLGPKCTNRCLRQIFLVTRGLLVFVATALIFNEFAT